MSLFFYLYACQELLNLFGCFSLPVFPLLKERHSVSHWARGTYGMGELHLTSSRAWLSSEGSALVTEAELCLPLSSVSGMLPLPSAAASWRFHFLLLLVVMSQLGLPSQLSLATLTIRNRCPLLLPHLIWRRKSRNLFFCGAQGLFSFTGVPNPWQVLVVL